MPRRGPGAPQPRATMADVAKVAGVSLKTVSRVVNGVESVNPRMASAVRAACAQLSFQPNRLAASLRSGESTSLIGLVIDDLGNPFYSRLAAGAAEVAEDNGCSLMIASSQGSTSRQSALIHEFVQRRVGGLIVTPTSQPDAALAHESKRGMPIVFADVSNGSVDVDVVRYDNHGAARQAVAEALRAGNRRLAGVFMERPEQTMSQRLAGMRTALADAGLTLAPDLVCDTCEPREAIRRMLAHPNPPTAIFCGNNVAGVAVAEVLASEAPDTTQICFDMFPLASVLPMPVIIIDHEPLDLGRRAAQRLLARLSGDDTGPSIETIVSTRIVTFPKEER